MERCLGKHSWVFPGGASLITFFVDWCTWPKKKWGRICFADPGCSCYSLSLPEVATAKMSQKNFLLLIFTRGCYRKKWCNRIFLLLLGFSLRVKREREEDLETKPRQIETKRKQQKQKFRAGAENSAWSPEKTTDGTKKKVPGRIERQLERHH